MTIHEAIACVRQHFHDADYLHLLYTRPVEAYSLNRRLLYRLCDAWGRFERTYPLAKHEIIVLAEAWLMSAPDFTQPLHIDVGWRPNCKHCGKTLQQHTGHAENKPSGYPPDRWVCDDGGLYEPIQYPPVPFEQHPG